jgi:ribosomal protein S19
VIEKSSVEKSSVEKSSVVENSYIGKEYSIESTREHHMIRGGFRGITIFPRIIH